jgi:plastocyanin
MATVVRSRTTLLVGAVILAALVLVFADIGGTGPLTTGTEVEVVMEDYRFVESEVRVPAGEPVTFVFVNQDEVTHSVSLGRTVTEEGGRAVGFAEDLLADLPVRTVPASALTTPQAPYTGLSVAVHGGEEVRLEVTLPESRTGTWQLGCFTGRGCHYQAGLAATLYVE